MAPADGLASGRLVHGRLGRPPPLPRELAERLYHRPAFQHLDVGDRVPDGPPESGCAFVVTRLEPDQHLVLRSTTHLPPGWAERFDAWLDWTWAFVLDQRSDGRTRFIVRSRVRAGPAWVAALYVLLVVPADFVMARQMLRGLRFRAEAGDAAG